MIICELHDWVMYQAVNSVTLGNKFANPSLNSESCCRNSERAEEFHDIVAALGSRAERLASRMVC